MIKFKGKVKVEKEIFVVDWLAEKTELSKIKIKKGIDLGGLWIKSADRKKKARVKKIKTLLKPNDFVEFYYNPDLNIEIHPDVGPVWENHSYGIWYKVASMPTDSTPFSDKGCLSSAVIQEKRNCFIVNRLDYAVSGLVLVAYGKKAAGDLSSLFLDNGIEKYYLAEVLGDVEDEGIIDSDLDGKTAITKYKKIDLTEKGSLVEIQIETGRFHQIRKHFNSLGNPVLGDPQYGRDNSDPRGMQLQAYRLAFDCPVSGNRIDISVPDDLKLFLL